MNTFNPLLLQILDDHRTSKYTFPISSFIYTSIMPFTQFTKCKKKKTSINKINFSKEIFVKKNNLPKYWDVEFVDIMTDRLWLSETQMPNSINPTNNLSIVATLLVSPPDARLEYDT